MAFIIYEQMAPPPHGKNRFRIVETFETCDGTRFRLTHKSFATYEEAQAFVKRDGKCPENCECIDCWTMLNR